MYISRLPSIVHFSPWLFLYIPIIHYLTHIHLIFKYYIYVYIYLTITTVNFLSAQTSPTSSIIYKFLLLSMLIIQWLTRTNYTYIYIYIYLYINCIIYYYYFGNFRIPSQCLIRLPNPTATLRSQTLSDTTALYLASQFIWRTYPSPSKTVWNTFYQTLFAVLTVHKIYYITRTICIYLVFRITNRTFSQNTMTTYLDTPSSIYIYIYIYIHIHRNNSIICLRHILFVHPRQYINIYIYIYIYILLMTHNHPQLFW